MKKFGMNQINLQYGEPSGQKDMPQDLLKKIVKQIYKEQHMRARRHIAFVYTGLASLISILSMAFYWMQASFINSGCMQLLSLIFSDFRIVAADWQDFSIAVLESLPILTIAIFLGIMFAVLQLLAYMAKDREKIARHYLFTAY